MNHKIGEDVSFNHGAGRLVGRITRIEGNKATIEMPPIGEGAEPRVFVRALAFLTPPPTPPVESDPQVP